MLDIRCINRVYPQIHAGELFLLSCATLITAAATPQTNISSFNWLTERLRIEENNNVITFLLHTHPSGFLSAMQPPKVSGFGVDGGLNSSQNFLQSTNPEGERRWLTPVGRQRRKGAAHSPLRLPHCYLISPVSNYLHTLAVSQQEMGAF